MSSSKRKQPPEGALWQQSLDATPLLFVDLEMTGLDEKCHRIIEVCLERVVGDRVERRLHSLVRPSELGNKVGNEAIHGISAADLASAPAFAELSDEVSAMLDGAVLVAHAARHDIAFLRAELARTGADYACPHYLDTLSLTRRVWSLSSYRLSALATSLSLSHEAPHRAWSDVLTTRALFARLVQHLEPRNACDLWRVGTGVPFVRPELIEAARAALAAERPVMIGYRRSGKPAEQILFQVTAVRSDLDPPMLLGYLQHTRGRRELRADHIFSLEVFEND